MRALVCLAVLAASSVWAQAPDAPSDSPHFLAADVHPSTATNNQASRGPFQSGQRYDFRNASLVDMVARAYGLPADRILEGPSWLEYDRFDIAALIPPRTASSAANRMLQALLTERFGLALKQEQRPMLAYALTAPKSSQKLKQSDGNGNFGCGFGISSGPRDPNGDPPTPTLMFNCRNTSMASFAANLSTNQFVREVFGSTPVQDKTGIEGNWDFTFKFPLSATGALSVSPATFFEAAESQLGLKFERGTVDLPVIVVEKANRVPSPSAADIAQKIPPAPTEFDVATLRPFEQGTGPNFMGTRIQPGGRIEISGLPLKSLVTQAWSMQADSIVGAPKWMDTDRYSIIARIPADEGSAGPQGNTPIDTDALFVMVRALLTERFQIKSHFEERPAPAYTLTASKQPKIKPADPKSRTKWTDSGLPIFLNGTSSPSRTIKIQNMTMAQFAEKLQAIAGNYVHSPVIDATGLEGGYDFSFSYSPILPAQLAQITARPAEGPPGANAAAADPIGGVSIFEAVDKQLGLKLVEQKRPAKYLVIDHIEQKPTDN